MLCWCVDPLSLSLHHVGFERWTEWSTPSTAQGWHGVKEFEPLLLSHMVQSEFCSASFIFGNYRSSYQKLPPAGHTNELFKLFFIPPLCLWANGTFVFSCMWHYWQIIQNIILISLQFEPLLCRLRSSCHMLRLLYLFFFFSYPALDARIYEVLSSVKWSTKQKKNS